MKRYQQGFTLIELMIVVAIIGILAAIAIPAYIDYTIRSKMSEAVVSMAAAKTAVAEFYMSQGHLPASTSTPFSTNIDSKYVNSVTWDGNVITAAIKAFANPLTVDMTVSLSPMTSNTRVDWKCKPGANNPVPTKFLPSSCQT